MGQSNENDKEEKTTLREKQAQPMKSANRTLQSQPTKNDKERLNW